MAQHNNLPLGRFLLLCGSVFVVMGAVFGCFIALVSEAPFLTVFGFIMAFFGAILAVVVIWGYILEPLLWDKMSGRSQEKFRNWMVGILLLVILILAPLGMFGGDKWSGNGQVNLFPDEAESVNYRLSADMEVATKWWWKKEYKINSVEWPQNGRSYFDNCIVSDSNFICSDNEGRIWRIEVEIAPDKPSRDD